MYEPYRIVCQMQYCVLFVAVGSHLIVLANCSVYLSLSILFTFVLHLQERNSLFSPELLRVVRLPSCVQESAGRTAQNGTGVAAAERQGRLLEAGTCSHEAAL